MAGKESITRLEFYFTGLPLFLKRNSLTIPGTFQEITRLIIQMNLSVKN